MARVLAARRLELAIVGAAITVALAVDGPGAVAIAGVVGFFVAKCVGSLRRTVS